MDKPLDIAEFSRQPMIVGTICFTDPTGNKGYKTDQIQASALVRIANALEAKAGNPLLVALPVSHMHAEAFAKIVAQTAIEWGSTMHVVASEQAPFRTLVTIQFTRTEEIFFLGKNWNEALHKGLRTLEQEGEVNHE